MPNEYRQRQIERNRDAIQTRREDHQAARTERRKHVATTRKTAYGDRVPKWPNTEPVYDLIAKVDQAMRDLFNEAYARDEADEAIGKQAAPTADRFPALGGE